MDTRFTEALLQKKVISQEQLYEARIEAEKGNQPIEDMLVARGVPENAIIQAQSEVLEVPVRNLGGKHISFDVLRHIPEESARHYRFVPLGIEDGVLAVGMRDPSDIEAREALQFIASKLNLPFKIFLITQSDFESVLGDFKGLSGEVTQALSELEVALADEGLSESTPGKETPLIEETPVIKIVAVILRHAVEGKASDIHIEPFSDSLHVRFRVDGVLHTSILLPIKVHDAVVSRVKILTNMQLDEKRKPQDGRFHARIGDRDIDFRVSMFPTNFGEKVVVRILDTTGEVKPLEELGMTDRALAEVKKNIIRPYGLILLTGPTGSGKTTSLYSMLRMLDREKNNVVSLEDPVEYTIPGVNQSQVRPEIGYTFANGLRSILRQDPDIMMVGEIRDKETAQLAIHAALTGHLVLSTLHTNNVIGVIPRLIDMGVDPFLIPPTLVLAVGQRLVQKLCEDSKKALPLEGKLLEKINAELQEVPQMARKEIILPKEIYEAEASNSCPRGVRGRTGIFEVLSMTAGLAEVILKSPSERAILEEAKKQGFITLRQDGIMKVLRGIIGLKELEAVTQNVI